MYRMPEKKKKTSGKSNVRFRIALEVVLPERLFDLLRFILYYFVQAELFHANLRFQKEKNFEETLCLQPRQFVFYFASLTLICKLLFIRRISLETKISILNSQMLAFWGTPFILAIKILKAKLQTFHSNVLMRES